MNNKSLIIPRGVLMCVSHHRQRPVLYKPIYPAIVLDGISSRTINNMETLKKWVESYILVYFKNVNVSWTRVSLCRFNPPNCETRDMEVRTMKGHGYDLLFLAISPTDWYHPDITMSEDFKVSFIIELDE